MIDCVSKLVYTMSSIKIKLPNDVEYEQPIGLFIDNKYVEAAGGEFEVIDPA